MDTNPYAPPQASVADSSSIRLKRRSLILMIVLTIVTFGFYYPIWFVRRRAALNQLDSPRKLRLWPFMVVIAWFGFQFILGVIAGARGPGHVRDPQMDLVLSLVQLAVGILLLVQSFFTKDILEDHLAGPEDQVPDRFSERIKFSGLMTFLFQIFYLQYLINRYIVGSKSMAA